MYQGIAFFSGNAQAFFQHEAGTGWRVHPVPFTVSQLRNDELLKDTSKKNYKSQRVLKKSLFLRLFNKVLQFLGPVVQLVRIRACHARGRGFESRPDRKKEVISI